MIDLAIEQPKQRWCSRLGRLSMLCLVIAIVAGQTGTLFYTPLHSLLNGWGMEFQWLRPLHLSAAVGWIYLAGIAIVLDHWFHSKLGAMQSRWMKLAVPTFFGCWLCGGAVIAVSLYLHRYGGREYFYVSVPSSLLFLTGWLVLAGAYIHAMPKPLSGQPAYVWMWLSSFGLFTYAFAETHAFLMPYLQSHPLRDTAVEWKSYGTLVGSFNLLVYGSVMYVGERINGGNYARSRLAFTLFMVGVVNSFTNYGHHTYHLPQWWLVKWISFSVSMTEIVILAKVVFDIGRQRQRSSTRNSVDWLLFATSAWTCIHLIVAILISIPPINGLFHGTLVVAGHAMGSMLGIDTMALLAALGWMHARRGGQQFPRWTILSINAGLLMVWSLFLVRGFMDGIRRWENGILPSVSLWPGWFGWAFAAGGLLMTGGILRLAVSVMLTGSTKVAQTTPSPQPPSPSRAHRPRKSPTHSVSKTRTRNAP